MPLEVKIKFQGFSRTSRSSTNPARGTDFLLKGCFLLMLKILKEQVIELMNSQSGFSDHLLS